MTLPKPGQRRWKRAWAIAVHALASAAQETALIRQTVDPRMARERASNVAVHISTALAAINELVAIIETSPQRDI